MVSGRITELATSILKETTELEDLLHSEGLPSPSFHATFPPKLDLSETASASLQNALEAADELHSLLLGPMGFIMHQLDGVVSSQATKKHCSCILTV
jgi:hypothetical protein